MTKVVQSPEKTGPAQSEPRYEFRMFATDLLMLEERLRLEGIVTGYRESLETYLVSPGNDSHNIKIRDACLDIKVLVGSKGALEHWRPTLKHAFPVPAEIISAHLPKPTGSATLAWQRPIYSLDEFKAEIASSQRVWVPVNVFKRRYGFELPECTAETAQVLVNGAAVSTVCLESEKPDRVLASASLLGCADLENVNYVTALKRIISLAPLPDKAYYRAW